jgi:anaerobic ribonucleoside-triphosphate reductase activating protein
MRDDLLRVHDFIPLSRANGPGRRAVLWVQGCTLRCPGCFNPQTHDPEGGEPVSVGALFERIVALEEIEGLSVSGGEPLQQLGPLLKLLRRLRRGSALSILIFTGYTWEEIRELPGAGALLACVDVLVAGRYDAARRVAGRSGLRSSANQSVHLLTDRYTPGDLAAVPAAEVILTDGGEVALSGVNPLRWEEPL